MNRLLRVLALIAAASSVALLGGLATSVAGAQQPPTKAPANVSPEEARAQQFQRVEGPQTEAIAAAPLLVGAYATIWVLLFGYLFLVARRQAATRAELDALEKLVVARARATDAQYASGGSSVSAGRPPSDVPPPDPPSPRPPSDDGSPAATDEPSGAS